MIVLPGFVQRTFYTCIRKFHGFIECMLVFEAVQRGVCSGAVWCHTI